MVPIWSTMRQTAKRAGQRIAAVMKCAVTQGYRDDRRETPFRRVPKNAVCQQHMRCSRAEVGTALAHVRASCAYLDTKLLFDFIVLVATRL